MCEDSLGSDREYEPPDPEPVDLDSLLDVIFEDHTWEEVLRAIATRATDQAVSAREQDQGGEYLDAAITLEHVTEELSMLADTCKQYRV